jgi:ParB-like chromosome segregation protein Spo0J
MQIVTLKIEDLVFDPNNARKHGQKNLDAIKGSLVKFGQQKPIVVNEKNIVLAGNGTLEAARQLGWDTIQSVVTDLDKFNQTAFSLADNRTAELASWDEEILGSSLRSLQGEEYDLNAIGFSDDDVIAFLSDWHSDIDKNSNVEKTDENLDGITSTIKITCPQEIKDEVLIYLKAKFLEVSFEGIHIG